MSREEVARKAAIAEYQDLIDRKVITYADEPVDSLPLWRLHLKFKNVRAADWPSSRLEVPKIDSYLKLLEADPGVYKDYWYSLILEDPSRIDSFRELLRAWKEAKGRYPRETQMTWLFDLVDSVPNSYLLGHGRDHPRRRDDEDDGFENESSAINVIKKILAFEGIPVVGRDYSVPVRDLGVFLQPGGKEVAEAMVKRGIKFPYKEKVQEWIDRVASRSSSRAREYVAAKVATEPASQDPRVQEAVIKGSPGGSTLLDVKEFKTGKKVSKMVEDTLRFLKQKMVEDKKVYVVIHGRDGEALYEIIRRDPRFSKQEWQRVKYIISSSSMNKSNNVIREMLEKTGTLADVNLDRAKTKIAAAKEELANGFQFTEEEASGAASTLLYFKKAVPPNAIHVDTGWKGSIPDWFNANITPVKEVWLMSADNKKRQIPLRKSLRPHSKHRTIGEMFEDSEQRLKPDASSINRLKMGDTVGFWSRVYGIADALGISRVARRNGATTFMLPGPRRPSMIDKVFKALLNGGHISGGSAQQEPEGCYIALLNCGLSRQQITTAFRSTKMNSGSVILYHIGKTPPKPKPNRRGEQWDRYWVKPTEPVVFLTPDPVQVAYRHGKHGNVYAVSVPYEVIKASGGIHVYDRAREVLIPESQWGKVKLLGISMREKELEKAHEDAYHGWFRTRTRIGSQEKFKETRKKFDQAVEKRQERQAAREETMRRRAKKGRTVASLEFDPYSSSLTKEFDKDTT